VRSGAGGERLSPVLAAGVGVRHGRDLVLRAASFRLDALAAAPPSLGISIARPETASAVIDVLAGLSRPAYGELRVLGHDLSAARGRLAVRRQVGVARRSGLRPPPAYRIRGLVEHAARIARLPGCDRHLLAAAIIDRLELTAWAEVPLRSAPEPVARRARLAAAAVHEPSLLLLDGLLDDLPPRDTAALGDAIRDLGRQTAIVLTGHDPAVLSLACDDLIALAGGVLVSR
jgi:ABC-type multidrug transport system ATPase subunit